MKENRQNSKRNNEHVLKSDLQRRYDGMERIKQEVKVRKRFEAKPYALIYQEEIKKLRKEGKIHE